MELPLRDVLSPNLASDRRVGAAAPILRRVFTNDLYEVFVGLYPGGLLATLVHYRREQLRIMSSLGDAPSALSEGDAWVSAAVEILKSSGRSPLHLIRDAKLECGLTLTLHDRAALKLAGVEVPRSAGRYKDLFLNPDNLD